jgi:CheY-like chemotaxis protein
MRRAKRILIVDDSMAFATYVTQLLRRMGFSKIIIADNGIEALKLLKIWTPDTVLMDIVIPGMDGMTALKHLKEDQATADIPIIMVSASESATQESECRELGSEGFLKKPVEVSSLYEMLQDCLAKTGVNKRRHIRTPFDRKVTIIVGGRARSCFAVSISEGGMFVRRKPPLDEGTEVEVVIPPEGESKGFRISGTVIYSKESTGNLLSMPTGVAIEFTGLTAETLRGLRRFITGLITSGRQPVGA